MQCASNKEVHYKAHMRDLLRPPSTLPRQMLQVVPYKEDLQAYKHYTALRARVYVRVCERVCLCVSYRFYLQL